jgi:outer membrane lipoprotein LolB
LKSLLRWVGLLLCITLVTACAHIRHDAPGSGAFWSGRLAVQVDTQSAQSFSASFELKGAPDQGEFTLFNPLGGTVARLEWQPGTAALHARGEVRQFNSLEALVTEATGAPLPLAALFDWLRGNNTPVPGWQADLSRLDDGRLTALRNQPLPTATLRVVLDK